MNYELGIMDACQLLDYDIIIIVTDFVQSLTNKKAAQ